MKRFVLRPLRLLQSKLVQNMARVMAGNLASYGSRFVMMAVVARSLGVDEFGLFSLGYATLYLVRLLSRLGLDVSAILLSTPEFRAGRSQGYLYFKVLLIIRFLSGVIVSLLAWRASGWVAQVFLDDAGARSLAVLSVVAGVSWSLLELPMSLFQAQERFTHYAVVNFLQAILLVGMTVLMMAFSTVTSANVLWIVTGTALVSFLITLPWWFKATMAATGNIILTSKQLFSIGKWVLISLVVTAVAGRLPFFALGNLSTRYQVGLYSAAYNLSSSLALISAPLFTTMLPHVSGMLDVSDARRYRARVRYYVWGGTLGLAVIGILCLAPIVRAAYGVDYSGATWPAVAIWMASLVRMSYAFSTPILYRFSRPWMIMIRDILQLVIMIGGFAVLIARHGALGASLVGLVVEVIGFIVIEASVTSVLSSPAASAPTSDTLTEMPQ